MAKHDRVFFFLLISCQVPVSGGLYHAILSYTHWRSIAGNTRPDTSIAPAPDIRAKPSSSRQPKPAQAPESVYGFCGLGILLVYMSVCMYVGVYIHTYIHGLLKYQHTHNYRLLHICVGICIWMYASIHFLYHYSIHPYLLDYPDEGWMESSNECSSSHE